MTKKKISHIITMGDSLSDRGEMEHRKLFDIIPMAILSGLSKRSPKGRFTTGLVWDDDLANFIYKRDYAQKYGQKYLNNNIVMNNKILNNFNRVKFDNQTILRSYDEGGLTSYNYAEHFNRNINRDAESDILSNLDKMRAKIKGDDVSCDITQTHKNETLVIEWSGANDLITINSDIYKADGLEKAKEQASLAVQARINNIKAMQAMGYKNFTLFNLPDLSLTPRFQNSAYFKKYNKNLSEHEAVKENAHLVCEYFNKHLQAEVAKLKNVSIFDANKIFCEAYQNPQKYGFKKSNLQRGVSFDFKKKNEANAAQIDGYMFWDDVHPTAQVHQILCNEFIKQKSKTIELAIPQDNLLEVFRAAYGQKFAADSTGCFGMFRKSKLNYQNSSLEDIFKHALFNKGYRTLKVLRSLGWLNNSNQFVARNPELEKAFKNAHQEKFPDKGFRYK